MPVVSEPRLSSRERRVAILEAAVAEFAERGLHGASTEAIAARVGISQPYVFKIFGTKKELFLAATDRIYDHILAAFRAGAAGTERVAGREGAGGGPGREGAGDPLLAMGRAFERLLSSRDELLMMLQSTAAVADPDVRDLARRRFGELFAFVKEASGATDFEVQRFMGYGLFLAFAANVGFSPSDTGKGFTAPHHP